MTYKEDAVVALFEADDDPLTASEVGKRMPAAPADTSTVLKRLFDDDFVDRHGDGKRGDPYRYELTSKGEAAARDYTNGDPPEDAGIDALFDATDDFDDDDYVSLSNDVDAAAVAYGTRYRATINNVEGFGVFVSLNTAEDDVTGLVHESKIPNGHQPRDFAKGDKVGVMLVDDGPDGLDFEMVASFDTVKDIRFERHPEHAPEPEPEVDDRDVAPDVDEEIVDAVEDATEDTDEPDEDTEVEPDAADHLIDAKVDATEERIADVERYVDGVDSRLKQVEDAVVDADNFVSLSDEDLVEAVYLIANSDAGGYRKKTDLIAELIGADADEDDAE